MNHMNRYREANVQSIHMSPIQPPTVSAPRAEDSSYVSIMNTTTDSGSTKDFLKIYRVGKIETVKHSIPYDIQTAYSKTENYCLFYFAQTFDGKKCNSFIANGICEYHWKCLNIMFVVMNNLVLENVEKGTYEPRTELRPVFYTPVGDQLKVMFPIIGSCKNETTVQVLLHSLFTSINPYNQGSAMARGLISMIFSQSPKAAVVRTSWINAQTMLFSQYDTSDTILCAMTNDGTPQAVSINDEFTIFDTPLLLSLQVATKLVPGCPMASAANVSLVYFKLNDEHVTRSGVILPDNSVVTNNLVGIYVCKGPILFAPNKKDFVHGYLKTGFYSVAPKLAGATQSDKFKIYISNINKAPIACVALDTQIKLYNNDELD